jgi:hypothetical protein
VEERHIRLRIKPVVHLIVPALKLFLLGNDYLFISYKIALHGQKSYGVSS